MSNHEKKVALAQQEIQQIGVHNIMDDELMPRAAATGWRVRKRPLINEPDTRPQRVDEWAPEFLFALQNLLRVCEPAEKVKSLLRRQVHRRQNNANLRITTQLARGLLLSDILRVHSQVVSKDGISTAQAGDKRKTRVDTPAENDNDVIQLPPTKKTRVAALEESGDTLGSRSRATSQHKGKHEPWVWAMLFEDLDRLKEMELTMEHVQERIEDEPTKRFGHTFAVKRLGESLAEMESKGPDAFGCACLELGVWEMQFEKTALAYKRVMVATRAAKICAYLEEHAGLVLEEHLKQRFISVLP